MGNLNRAVGPYIRSILKLDPPLSFSDFTQHWHYFILLHDGEYSASISVSLPSLYFNRSESGWVYDMPVGQRFWRGVISVRGFLVYHVDDSRSPSERKLSPIFLPLSMKTMRFSPLDFVFRSEASNRHLTGLLSAFSKGSTLTNLLEKMNHGSCSDIDFFSQSEFTIVLRSTAQFVSEDSMLSGKNFLTLLLCPPVFDSKKLEQIDSCISFPSKVPTSGLVKGMLPSGVEFEITVCFLSNDEITICAAIQENNSTGLLAQCVDLSVSLLEKISNLYSFYLANMPILEWQYSIAPVPNELLESWDSLALHVEDFKIKQKESFFELSEKESVHRRILRTLLELRLETFNSFFRYYC